MSEAPQDAARELAEKARFWTSETVNARLDDTFEAAERHAAAVSVAGLVGEVPGGEQSDSDEASCRLMLDAIKVSGGDLVKLQLWVEAAKSDPRDLIAAAEYRRELESPSAQARIADLAEYVTWANGSPGGMGTGDDEGSVAE